MAAVLCLKCAAAVLDIDVCILTGVVNRLPAWADKMRASLLSRAILTAIIGMKIIVGHGLNEMMVNEEREGHQCYVFVFLGHTWKLSWGKGRLG